MTLIQAIRNAVISTAVALLLFGCNGRNLLRRSRPTLPCRHMKENEQRVLSTAAGPTVLNPRVHRHNA